MANKLELLRRALRVPVPVSDGEIVSFDAKTLVVQTRDGIKRLRKQSTDTGRYRVGDRVAFAGDIVTGRLDTAAVRYTV